MTVPAPPPAQRILPWQARRLGAEVIRLRPVDRWPDPDAVRSPENCLAFDAGVLLYPGSLFGLSHPVPSVRLKHLRDGLEDIARLRLLDDHGLSYVTEMIAKGLVRYAGTEAYRTHLADGRFPGWPASLRPFELARDIMTDAITGRIAGAKEESVSERLRRTVAWRRFIDLTRRVRLRADGARVRYVGDRDTFRAEIEAALSVDNAPRTPLSGRLRSPRLPPGFHDDPPGETTVHAPPGGAVRATLRWIADGFATGSAGIVPVTVVLERGEAEPIETTVRVAFVTAVPIDTPPLIDGSLSDWPPALGNVAGDFQPITGPSCGDNRPKNPSPRTLAFFMRDADALYIAVNAEGRPDVSHPLAHSNVVVYDDLVPRGGDLVEILLDPLNAGTRSPGDLFHLTVKPSGAYRMERGLRTDPPCGPWEPWPADVQVAARVAADRWTVEIRIPFSSFGDVARTHTIWGMNVTRFEESSLRFTTWSGTRGNAYDPLALGNLYLP
ncbi:MAG: DUF4091 domain-containing protein [Planctomycetota bacterium]|nr:MAG: DUF4091 domain-containing protein [Planctomycetota bacterium]